MAEIERSIVVNAPLREVYNQWTQFEDFPRFMEGVIEVRQLDDKRLHWRAKVGGKESGTPRSSTRCRTGGSRGRLGGAPRTRAPSSSTPSRSARA